MKVQDWKRNIAIIKVTPAIKVTPSYGNIVQVEVGYKQAKNSDASDFILQVPHSI